MPRELAQLLVDEGAVTAGDVERAVARQREVGGTLDSALLELGLVAEPQLLGLLSRASDLPAAPLSAYEAVDARARRVFPSKVAERHGLAPFALDGRELSLVATHPLDLGLLDEISFMLSLHLSPHVGPEWRVRALIHRLYGGTLSPRLQRLAGGAPAPPQTAPAAPPPPAPPPPAPAARPGLPARPPGFTGFTRDEGEPLEPLAAALAQAAEQFDLSWEEEPAAPEPPAERPPGGEPAAEAPAAARPDAPAPVAPPEPPPRPIDRSAPPHWTMERARAVLAQAARRDEVVLAALRYARDFFQYAALFAVTRDAVAGHDALGPEEGTREVCRTVALYASDPGIFRTAIETLAPYLGPVSRESAGSVAVLDGLWRGSPRAALVYPILLRDRPVCILYADNGEAPVSARRLGDLLLFLSTVGGAFERIIRARKDPSPAHAPAAPVAPRPPEPEPAPAFAAALESPLPPPPGDDLAVARPPWALPPVASSPPAPPEAEPRPQATPAAAEVEAESLAAPFAAVPLEVREEAPDEAPEAPATTSVAEAPPLVWPAFSPVEVREPAVEPLTVPEPEPESTPGPVAPPEPVAPTEPGPAPAVKEVAEAAPPANPATALAALEEAFFASAPPASEPPAGEPPASEPPASEPPAEAPLAAPPPAEETVAPRPPPPTMPVLEDEPDPLPTAIPPEIAAAFAGQEGAADPAPAAPAPPLDPATADPSTLVGRYLMTPRGSDERATLLARMVDRADEVAPVLVDQLPGPLDVEPEALARTPAADQGPVLAAVAALGPAAVRPLLALLTDPAPARRRAAAALLGQAGDARGFLPLADRCFDPDPEVAAAARGALAAHRRDPAMKAVPDRLRRALLSGLSERAAAAARAISALRDAESIPLLIQALEGSDAGTAAASADALFAITMQRHGTAARQWLMWWKVNRGRGRAEWLFGALSSEDREVRVQAATELREVAPSPVAFSVDLPPQEREQAARAWAGWFARGGHRI